MTHMGNYANDTHQNNKKYILFSFQINIYMHDTYG